MKLNTLGRISLIYAAAMLLICPGLIVVRLIEFGAVWSDGFYHLLVGLAHALAQMIYSSLTLRKLGLPTYEQLDTLDNEFTFSANGFKIYRNPVWLISLTVFATLVELLLGYISVSMLSSVQTLLKEGGVRGTLLTLLYIVSLLGCIPTVLYNLRTWNMLRVLPERADEQLL